MTAILAFEVVFYCELAGNYPHKGTHPCSRSTAPTFLGFGVFRTRNQKLICIVILHLPAVDTRIQGCVVFHPCIRKSLLCLLVIEGCVRRSGSLTFLTLDLRRHRGRSKHRNGHWHWVAVRPCHRRWHRLSGTRGWVAIKQRRGIVHGM